MSGSLTPVELQEIRESAHHAAVIDIREIRDYVESHIKHSTHIPRRDLEFRIPEVVPNSRVTVVLCDRDGDRAPRDADWLSELGYTDVRYLAGGLAAWQDAGLDVIAAQGDVYSTALNYPSKDFGEKVHVQEGIEQISPDELKSLLDNDEEDVLVADVRTPEEHAWKTIPGALNVEGVDLGLYIDHLRTPDQPVIVHCTGRTRSIIGTASLRKLGYDNVYELENGTMGWELAGYTPEEDANRHVTDLDVGPESRAAIRSKAHELLDENDIPLIPIEEFEELRAAEEAVVYPVDVRKHTEYEGGHIPGSVSIPGGQAIQTAVDHFGVRTGTIVFISDHDIRSAVTAYWFSEMGYPNVMVLAGGIRAWDAQQGDLAVGPADQAPLEEATVTDVVSYLTPEELADEQESMDELLVDVSMSHAFTENHIEGATWVPRYELESWLDTREHESLVLVSQDDLIAEYAAAAIQELDGREDVVVLTGGPTEWRAAGLSVTAGTDGMAFSPRDEIPRSASRQDDQAKKQYLDWEAELGEQYTE